MERKIKRILRFLFKILISPIIIIMIVLYIPILWFTEDSTIREVFAEVWEIFAELISGLKR